MKTYLIVRIGLIALVLLPAPLLAANPANFPETLPPDSIAADSATLHGRIGLNGKAAHVAFQWRAVGARRWVKRTPWQKIARGQTNVSFSALLAGLVPDTDYEVRAMSRINTVIRKGNIVAFRTGNTEPATSVTGPAESIGPTTATLTGTVNTRGNSSAAYFEWGTTTSYGNVVAVEIASSSEDHPVQATLAGLAPNTTYHFRLAVSNQNGVVSGSDRTFTTTFSFAVATGGTANATPTNATLAGAVTTTVSPVNVFFEWGTTTTYGNSTAPVLIAAGSSDSPVQAEVSGLFPGITYHFRVVGTNAEGAVLGSDMTLVLPAPPCLPAPVTATVTNNTEFNLRTALLNANVIHLDADGTITLTSPIEINCAVTLDASGRSVTISGGNSNRLFNVKPGGNLHLVNLTLANGRDRGTNANIVSSITGCDGDPDCYGGPASGGAILVEQGSLTAANCTFTNNAAIGGAGNPMNQAFLNLGSTAWGGRASGGAIFGQSSAINLTNCTFVDQETLGGPGGWINLVFLFQAPPGLSKGGALYLSNCTTVLEQCHLEQNQSVVGIQHGGQISGFGGAIYVDGGALHIAGSSIISNVAQGEGGAIYNAGGIVNLTDSELSSNAIFGGSVASGGAVCVGTGTLTALNTTFFANAAFGKDSSLARFSTRAWLPGQPAQGGGLAVLGGTATVSRCYFGQNLALGGKGGYDFSFGLPFQAGDGIGGAVFNAGTAIILNSTFAHNSALPGGAWSDAFGTNTLDSSSGKGGAIANAAGALFVQFSTVAYNTARRGTNHFGQPLGGGIFAASGTTTLDNSILAWNQAELSFENASGSITDAGNNLSSDATPALSAAGSGNNIDPLLGALGNNGGPTFTFPLLPGSPAINTANPSGAPATDQRGVSRPQGPAPDIGAFERQ